MTRHALSERLLMCDELLRVGPDAPTKCEGWDTADLAAHLVVRESRPDLAVGLVLPFLRGRLEREQSRMASGDYAALVERVRGGAPVWNPMHLDRIDEAANLVEFFVHHEDVRRAQPAWEPRELEPDLQHALWVTARRGSRLMYRKAPTGIVLIAPGHGRHSAKLPDDHGTVVVRGTPAELVLFAYGRKDVAKVGLSGTADDVAALEKAHLGVS
jgi:uncharacterized protein (TIGR03085 family)